MGFDDGRLPGDGECCGHVGAGAAADRADCGVLLGVLDGHRVEDEMLFRSVALSKISLCSGLE